MTHYTNGDQIEVTCDGRTVEGVVLIASPNNVSLAIGFEAIFAGHVGMMPIFRHDDGVYRSIIDGKTEVFLQKKVVQ